MYCGDAGIGALVGAELVQKETGLDVKSIVEGYFSWLQARLRPEHTRMSWVRISVWLIGFSFIITQLFEQMKGPEGSTAAHFLDAPRCLGLALIQYGVIALVVSVCQWRLTFHYLPNSGFDAMTGVGTEPKQTPLHAVVTVLALIVTFVFFAVRLRLT
jgi:uncharacterized membrane protein YidH (DUF202 family)